MQYDKAKGIDWDCFNTTYSQLWKAKVYVRVSGTEQVVRCIIEKEGGVGSCIVNLEELVWGKILN